MDLPGGSVSKNPPTNAGNVSLIPGSGISLGEENGNSVQNSCLGNPMDSGTWWATVHGVTEESNTAWQLNKTNNNDVSISMPPTRFVPPSPSPFCTHVHSLCLGLWSCLQIGWSAPFPRFQTYVLVDNICTACYSEWVCQVVLVVKNLPANTGDIKDLDLNEKNKYHLPFDQNHPQETEMPKVKMVDWGGLTNSWEKKRKTKEKRKDTHIWMQSSKQ